MADVAKGSVLLTPRFDNLTSSVNKALSGAFSSASSSSKSAGTSTGSNFASGFSAKTAALAGTVGGIMSTVASTAISAISSSMGAAVSRVDTLNNFPKVMQNLGYAAEDASTSIQKISTSLDGLPSSTDNVAAMVQQLAPMCSSLDEATSLGLAMNDMFLASGASTADCSRAMQQYTQIMTKGKPDLQDWKTLQEVMPGQLNQVSEALLGAGSSSTDLYNALKAGTVTMDDFNATVMRLDSEGTGAYASFAQQAKDATQGIGTAMDNVQNRIAKAIAKIIDAIGAENISGAINAFSSSFSGIADKVVAVIEVVKPYVAGIVSFVQENFGAIAGVIGTVAAAIAGYALEGKFATIATTIATVSKKVGGTVSAFVSLARECGLVKTAIGLMTNPVGAVVAAIAALIAAFVALYANNEEFRAAVNSAWEQIQAVAAVVWPAVQQAFTQAWQVMQDVFNATWPVIQAVFTAGMDTFLAVVNAVWPVIQAVVTTAMSIIQAVIQTVMAAINGDWSGVWNGIQALAGAVWNGIQSIVSSVISAIQGIISSVLSSIQNIMSSAWNACVSIVSGAFGFMASAVSGGINNVISFVSTIPSRILSALGNVGSLLYNAGCSIIDGLRQGIVNAVQGVYDFVSGIAGKIASLKGPISYDRVVLTPNGEALMESLLTGIKGGVQPVYDYVGGIADDLSERMSVSSNLALAGAATSSVTSTVSTSGSLLDRLDTIASRLEGHETAVYVDGKKLASTIAKPMNQQLGVLARRGA